MSLHFCEATNNIYFNSKREEVKNERISWLLLFYNMIQIFPNKHQLLSLQFFIFSDRPNSWFLRSLWLARFSVCEGCVSFEWENFPRTRYLCSFSLILLSQEKYRKIKWKTVYWYFKWKKYEEVAFSFNRRSHCILGRGKMSNPLKWS